mgnify:CR=1 FL=1
MLYGDEAREEGSEGHGDSHTFTGATDGEHAEGSPGAHVVPAATGIITR